MKIELTEGMRAILAEISKGRVTGYINKVMDNDVSSGTSAKRNKGFALALKKTRSIDSAVAGYPRAKVMAREEVEDLDEGMRVVGTHFGSNKQTAKVYKDSEYGEHVVKFFKDGQHQPDADYHTDDSFDAHETAKKQIGGYGYLKGSHSHASYSGVKEETELDEARGRPPKEGSAAWHKRNGTEAPPKVWAGRGRRPKGEYTNSKTGETTKTSRDDEPRADYKGHESILGHLAATIDNPKHETTFSDGSTHVVPQHIAKDVHGHLLSMRPKDRASLQDLMQQSRKHLDTVHSLLMK